MWVKVLLLFFVLSFLIRTDNSFDQDLGRHIKLGEIIVNTQSVPKTNLFSYTNADFPFINTHWLFGVIAYIFDQSIGLQALLVLKVLMILLSVWLTLSLLEKKYHLILLPVGFVFLHVLRERLELRPEVFSFLFTSLTLFILNQFLEKRTRLVYFLPLIQLVWINTHIYFFVGFLIQAIFSLHLIFARQWQKVKILLVLVTSSLVLSLLNPNGLNGLFYPLNVTKNYGYTIVENQNLFFLEQIKFKDPNFLFVKISAVLVILSIIISAIKKSFSLKDNLLAFAGLALCFMHVRSFPYLIFLSLVPTAKNLYFLSSIFAIRIVPLLFLILLAVESFLYLNGSYYSNTDSDKQVKLEFVQSGQNAITFLLEKNLPQPIFNNFDIGSYIIYKGYPKVKTFVDGRPEAYPVNFFQEEYIPIQYNYQKFKIAAGKSQFKTIIFSHTDQTPWGQNFLKEVTKDSDWKIAYLDDFIIILVKSNYPSLAKINLSKLDPGHYNFGNSISYLKTGIFLLNMGYSETGIKFVSKALERNPQSPVANSIMASVLGSLQLRQKSTNFYFW
ncbi:hypothetical protein HYW42_04945 [Candidatus Daviesbacteria bacterium]|nr:hypothetical protein [Candidatus Daviesbacteria bacterium]